MGTEANQGRAFLLKGGQDNLTRLAVGHQLAGVRVHNLNVHVIRPDVHGGVGLTVDTDARAIDLGKAVNVVELHTQLVGDAGTHLLTPTLGADDALAQLDAVLNTPSLNLLGQLKGVGTGGAQHGRTKILHELKLLVRVARSHGQGHSAQALATRLESGAGGPQSIARGDLHHVLWGQAGILVAAGKLNGPVFQVLGGIRNDHRRACSARRAMHTDNLLLRHSGQPHRICLAQIRLLRKRQGLKGFLGGDLVKVNALKLLGVERAALLQALELRREQLPLLGGESHVQPLCFPIGQFHVEVPWASSCLHGPPTLGRCNIRVELSWALYVKTRPAFAGRVHVERYRKVLTASWPRHPDRTPC